MTKQRHAHGYVNPDRTQLALGCSPRGCEAAARFPVQPTDVRGRGNGEASGTGRDRLTSKLVAIATIVSFLAAILPLGLGCSIF